MVKSQTLDELIELGSHINARVFGQRSTEEISGRLISYDEIGYTIQRSHTETYFIPVGALTSFKVDGTVSPDIKETLSDKVISVDRVNNHILIDGQVLTKSNSKSVVFGPKGMTLLSELIKSSDYRVTLDALMATGVFANDREGIRQVYAGINYQLKDLGYKVIKEGQYLRLVF